MKRVAWSMTVGVLCSIVLLSMDSPNGDYGFADYVFSTAAVGCAVLLSRKVILHISR